MNNISQYLFYILIVLLAPKGANAQLDIVNQYAFGGDDNTQFDCLVKSSDGGFYLVYNSSSSVGSGNINVDPFGLTGVIVSKYDLNNILDWEKSYGGNSIEYFGRLVEVTDGMLLCMASVSGVSGEKEIPSFGGTDGWLLKLDFDGEIIWQKGYGGSDEELIFRMISTMDGNIIMGYRSESEVSGNRTAPLKGTRDYWVVNTDSEGEIIWDYSYGSDGEDFLSGIGELSNGTLVLSGVSIGSTVSHDKTEPPFSGTDNWIVAIDSDGAVLWDRTIGGTGAEGGGYLLTIEDTIYVLSHSSSGVSGLRTEPLKGQQDLWLTKLDKDGNIISTHYYGGDQFEFSTGIFQLNNEHILLCSRSNSNTSFDKSENTRGGMDYWGVIIDKNGQVISEKTIGGSGTDDLVSGILHQNKLILAGGSLSGVSGDKTISKLDAANTGSDVWIVELDGTTLEVVNSNTVIPNVYPNPVTDVLTIDLSSFSHIYALDVYDLKGVLISKKIISGTPDSIQLDFSDLSNGVYTVLVHSHNGTSALKVVK